MLDLPRRHLALYVLAALVVAALGWRQLAGRPAVAEPDSPTPAPIRVERSDGGAVVVHVAGAVRNPGVYRLRAGTRVDDAVRRAGGATRRAELSAVNLAAELEDGRQVVVPERARAGVAGASPAGAPGGAALPLNLNAATLEQLDTLDGIGPAMAQRILEHRESKGGFGNVEELAEVPGIGPKRMEALRERVRV